MSNDNAKKVYVIAGTSPAFYYLIAYIIPSVLFLILPFSFIYYLVGLLFESNFQISWGLIIYFTCGFAVMIMLVLFYFLLKKYWVFKIVTDASGIAFFGFFRKIYAHWDQILSIAIVPLFVKVITKNGVFFFPLTMKEKDAEYPKSDGWGGWIDANGSKKTISPENCSLYQEIQHYLNY